MADALAYDDGMRRRKQRPAPPSEWAIESARALMRRAGIVVRQIRQAKNWSMEDLGHAAGIHKNTVQAIETKGANLSMRKWDLLAKALGVRLSDVVGSADADMNVRLKILARFRDSPARQYESVQDDELDWLKTQPLEAYGEDASPKTILHLVLAHRRPQ